MIKSNNFQMPPKNFEKQLCENILRYKSFLCSENEKRRQSNFEILKNNLKK